MNCTRSWSVQPSLPSTFKPWPVLPCLQVPSPAENTSLLSPWSSVCRDCHEHSRNLFEPYRVVLPKNTMVNVPQEPGPANAIFIPVVWRQSKLYFQSQTPTSSPPMSVCPLVFTHKPLTQSKLVSKQHTMHTAALTSRATLSPCLPSLFLLKMLSLLIIALHHISHPTTPPQSWSGHSPVTAQGLTTPPFALKQIWDTTPPQEVAGHLDAQLALIASYAINVHVNSQWFQQNCTSNTPFHKLLAQSETYQKRKVALYY